MSYAIRIIKKKSRPIFLLSLLMTSSLPLFFVHSYAFLPHLRHGMVEDGIISLTAGDLLDERSMADKYNDLMARDGKLNGRYRPGYFIYQTIPFFLTLVKNGDYDWGMNGNDIRNRINGDLRFHMVFVLCTIAVVFYLCGIMIWSVSGSKLYALLYPLSIIFSSPLVRNVTYNDTAEIPQLIGIIFYLSIFLMGEKSANKKFNRKFIFSLLAIPVIAYAYLSKETSIVLFPAIVSYVFFKIRGNIGGFFRQMKKAENIYLSYHIVLNALMTCWVIVNVSKYWGSYSQTNYTPSAIPTIFQTFSGYLKVLTQFPPTFYIPVFSICIIVYCLIFEKNADEKEIILKKILPPTVLFTVLASFFVVINLPWKFVLERYMLPSAIFSSLMAAVIIGWFHCNLILKDRKYIPILLFVGIVIWSFNSGKKEYYRVQEHYSEQYDTQRYVDPLSDDIVFELKQKKESLKVHLDLSKQSHWLWMQLARILNQEKHLNVNITVKNNLFERLYLKNRKNSGQVMLDPSDGYGYFEKDYDIIYSGIPLDPDGYNKKMNHLRILDGKFISIEKITVKKNKWETPNYIVIKFVPFGDPIEAFQRSNKILLQILPQKYSVELETLHDIQIVKRLDTIALEATGNDPHFLLPQIENNGYVYFILYVNLWSPVETNFKIYYKSLKQPFFNEDQTIEKKIKPGNNKLYNIIPASTLIERIRIDPSEKPGEYLLKHLEIRAIERDQ